jgi:tetratricopeptide (TPR) repeat protein
MKRTVAAVAAIAALACTTTFAAEPKLGKFVAYEIEGTIIISSRGEAQVKRLLTDLAQFKRTLEIMLSTKSANSGVPTHLFIVNKREWETYLQLSQGNTGLFMPRRFANYMLVNGDGDRESQLQIIFHEYTHFFLRSQFSGEYPPWFNEGLAELMGMARFKGPQAILQVPVGRVMNVRDGKWIPFDRLIRIDHDSPEYMGHHLAPVFYGQAWLTVQYGFLEDRQFGGQVMNYLTRLNRLVPLADAARLSFGEDLAAVDKKLFDYSRRPSLAQGLLNIGEPPPLTLGAARPLSETEALASIADVMMEIRLSPERTRPLVDAVGKREQSARAETLQMRLALLEEDDAKFNAALERGAKLLAADDWQARRDMALTVLNRAMNGGIGRDYTSEMETRDREQAMRWFDEALAKNPDDVQSLWGYGAAAVQLRKNLELAEPRLVQAYKKMPSSEEIAMALANLHGVKGDPKGMIPYLKDVIRYANQLQTRTWALETLRETQKYVDELAAFEAEQEKRRQEAEKRAKRKK